MRQFIRQSQTAMLQFVGTVIFAALALALIAVAVAPGMARVERAYQSAQV